MLDVRSRMGDLTSLLTGETGRASRYSYPPRHLWGDIGLPEGRPRPPLARLLRWQGSGR